jgi:hypothetical protein
LFEHAPLRLDQPPARRVPSNIGVLLRDCHRIVNRGGGDRRSRLSPQKARLFVFCLGMTRFFGTKLRTVATIYTLGGLVTAAILVSVLIATGDLTGTRPALLDLILPAMFILGCSALWPIFWAYVLLYLFGLLRPPIIIM